VRHSGTPASRRSASWSRGILGVQPGGGQAAAGVHDGCGKTSASGRVPILRPPNKVSSTALHSSRHGSSTGRDVDTRRRCARLDCTRSPHTTVLPVRPVRVLCRSNGPRSRTLPWLPTTTIATSVRAPARIARRKSTSAGECGRRVAQRQPRPKGLVRRRKLGEHDIEFVASGEFAFDAG